MLRSLPLLFALAITSLAADPTWKVGVAKVAITPKEPMRMAGYASRTHAAEGKAQDLFAKALAIEDEQGHRLVIITLDLIGEPRPLRDHLVARLGEKYKLPPEGLLLNASHTHCGPEFQVGDEPGIFVNAVEPERALAYGKALEDQLFELAGNALTHLVPATLSYHHARCGFSMNRRLPVEGKYQNSPNPEGPVDQAVPVLQAKTADGNILALLFGYACHNTTLSFYQWCGDYAGFAQEDLESDYPGTIALFMQGCGGDQNPYPRGRIELAQIHGRSLCSSVEAALQNAGVPVTGPLELAFGDVPIEFAPQPARAEFEQQAAQTKDGWLASHAKRMLARLDLAGKLPEHYPYPVEAVRFGHSLTLLAFSGETTVDFSLRMKHEHPETPLWVAGYSNDVMGYIPSLRVLKEGGYEAGDSMKFGNLPYPWADSTEEKIVGEANRLLGTLP